MMNVIWASSSKNAVQSSRRTDETISSTLPVLRQAFQSFNMMQSAPADGKSHRTESIVKSTLRRAVRVSVAGGVPLSSGEFIILELEL